MMIKLLIGGGDFITVTQNSSVPYFSPGAQSAGIVRFNINSNTLEAYDGNSWRDITTSVTISINHEYEKVLKWAKEEMIRQQRIKELAKKHEIIADLQDKLDVMVSLLQEEK